MKTEKTNALSIDFIGGENVMPITGYYGPHPQYHEDIQNEFSDYYADEFFQAIAEAGINLIVHYNTDYKTMPDLVKRTLELGEKYKVGLFVFDSNVTDQIGDCVVSKETLEEEIQNYADYPAFCGMFVVDEPSSPCYQPGTGKRHISRYGHLARTLQHEMGLTCYLNMFPIWGMLREHRREDYEQYVAEFCETLRPKVLMWDNYPFSSEEGLDVYFYNMNLMREYANQYKVPFWPFIQAGGQWNDEKKPFESTTPYFPSKEQFDWNVNTSLAFGAKGIQYFPLLQPEHFAFAGTEESPEWDFNRNGLFGANGQLNPWYYYAQEINAHIRVIDEVLMNSVHKGVIVTGEQAKEDLRLTTCVIESGQFQELKDITGDVMIGCFNYNGKTALYVVNYSMESAQTVDLCFDQIYDFQVMQKATTSHACTQQLQLDMMPGEGVMIVVDSEVMEKIQ